jgi:hypothetical protein
VAAVALLGMGGAAQAQSNDPSFRINNNTGTTIFELYVSSVNDNGWGRDLLGANVLRPGQSFIVRLPSGQCLNDIRVVWEGGRPQEFRRRDTCQIVDFNIN